MRRPVPPATFKTLVPETRTDLQRLRDHSKDILDWIDEHSGGGAGTITEIDAGPGIAVTDGTGPVVTVAADFGTGAGQIPTTADVSSRLYADFDANYANKATPVAADQVAINDSAAGGVPKYASVTSLLAAAPIAVSGNPYVDPPLVPNAFDDEFDGGSPDLASRGYSVTNSAGTTLTRAGAVDPWNATGPVAGTYLSSIVGSQLLVQFPNVASTYTISKPVVLASGDTYFARVGSSNRFDSGTQSNTLEFGFYATAGGTADTNNRIYVSSFSTSSGASGVEMFRGTAGAYSGSTRSPIGAQIGDIRGVNWVSGTTYRPFLVDSSDGDTQTTNVTGAIASTAVQVVAFRFTPNTAWGGTMPVVISIDFVRKTTANAWIAQTPRPVLWNVVSGDISQYPSKPTPVATDQIYIADSAASNAIKRATLATIGVTAPWLTPPTSPDFADEFLSDSLLANFSIYNRTNSTAVTTRLGDVDWHSSGTAIGNSQYRSSLLGGMLFVQIPASKDYVIYRAVTAGDREYTARMECLGYGAYAFLIVSASSAGLPDLPNCTFIGWDPQASVDLQRYQNVGGAATNDGVGAGYPDMHAVVERFTLGTTRESYHYSIIGGRCKRHTTRTFTPTRAFFGFRLGSGSTTESTVFMLDFIREQAATGWVVSQ